MPTLDQIYESRLRRNIAKVNRNIARVYQSSISEITLTASTISWNGRPFSLGQYPSLKKKVDQVLKEMQAKIFTAVVNGIEESWDLSNKKNNILVDRRLAKSKLPKNIKQTFYDPNIDALKAFKERRENGMDLSNRVWNTLDPFKKELEQSIGLAIADGKPAAETARNIKKYLNEPDRRFRRVRSEDGSLKLSKAARDYNPGQGVYRSSHKNAMRLARTETNMSYRTADHDRWQSLPFVTGIEVRLSNAHPKYDICDRLKGKYPKDFLFRGWHPQCLCNAVAVMASDKDFEAMEDAILAGEDIPMANNQVEDVPDSFKGWLTDNIDRVNGWKNKPYFMRDNSDYVE